MSRDANLDQKPSGGRIEADRLQWGSLRDWGQLVRLPTVFTLLSNCIAAAIVVGSQLLPWTALLPTCLASVCAYWAGMILNDVVDLQTDREYRPERPLVSAKISPVVAGHVANGLLLLGPILILAVSSFHPSQPLWMGAAFACSVILSLCVRCYNSFLKRTPLGPLLMGACRGLNILMVGCSMLAVGSSGQLPRPLLIFALGTSVYIVGITVFALREERQSSTTTLTIGLMIKICGLAMLACLPLFAQTDSVAWFFDPKRGYPLLIGLIGLTVANRSLSAVFHPVSRKVQLAVKHAILTLILLDASLVLMWAGPWYGVATVALLLPAFSAAIRFRST